LSDPLGSGGRPGAVALRRGGLRRQL